MAGASDPLEDMLFSEVDEKAVSDLVGSLESQLGGQRDATRAQPENARPGSARQQQQQQAGGRAHVDSPSEPQQQTQQQNARKAARNPDSDPKDASMEKHPKALEKESPLKSHGSIIIITTAAASDGGSAPAPGNKGESPRDTRKKHPNARARRASASHSLNGAASASASASPSTSSPTITVASNPQAIALDRGTPTIALHRLPRHIIASIAQNGNGTSVSALVQQGARIGAAGAQVNHTKAPGINAKAASPPAAPAATPVKPAVSVSSTPAVRPAQTPAQQRLVTPQLIVRPPQQQTTIQLPPGFTIPPGTDLSHIMRAH